MFTKKINIFVSLLCFNSLAFIASATIDYATIFENVNGSASVPFAGTNGLSFKTSGFQSFSSINTGSNVHSAKIMMSRGVGYTIQVGGNFVDLCTKVELYTSATATVPRWTLLNKPDNDPLDKVKAQSGKISFNIGNIPLTEGTSFIIKIRYGIETNGPDMLLCTIGNRGTIIGAKWVGTTFPIYVHTPQGWTREQLNFGSTYRLQLTVSGLPDNSLVANSIDLTTPARPYLPTVFTKVGVVSGGVGTFEGSFTVTTVSASNNDVERDYFSYYDKHLLDHNLKTAAVDAHGTGVDEVAIAIPFGNIGGDNQTTHATDLAFIALHQDPPVPVQNPANTNLVITHGGDPTFNPVVNNNVIESFSYHGENFLRVITSACTGDPISRSLLFATDPILGEQRKIEVLLGTIIWGPQDIGPNPPASYPAFTSQLYSNGVLLDAKTTTSFQTVNHLQTYTYPRPPVNVFLFPMSQGSKCYVKDTNNGVIPPLLYFEGRVDTGNTVQEFNETDNNASF